MIYISKSETTDSISLISDTDLRDAIEIKLYITRNTSGAVVEVIPTDMDIQSCGYSIILDIDMTLIDTGSYICQLETDNVITATEEIVIEDDVTETSSSYDGVKIID